jgi:hypothetical protein
MVSFVHEHSRRAELGAAARLRSHEFSWDRSIDRWERALLEASRRDEPQAHHTEEGQKHE